MKIYTTIAYSTSLIALLSSAPAAAQEYYLGAGVELGNATDDAFFSAGRDESNTLVTIIGGMTFSSGPYFYGAELEYSIPTSGFEGCCASAVMEYDSSYRAKALIGYDLGQFDIFATGGLFGLNGSVGILSSLDAISGITFGFGTQFAVSDRFDVRIEAIQDSADFDDSGYGTATWTNTTIRAAAIFTF